MDVNNIVLLTNDQQIELQQYQELFASPGFVRQMQKVKQELAAVESAILNSVQDERELYYCRGQRSKLLSFIGLELSAEAYFNGLVGDLESTQEEQEDSFGANA